jgi:hypothetical protein
MPSAPCYSLLPRDWLVDRAFGVKTGERSKQQAVFRSSRAKTARTKDDDEDDLMRLGRGPEPHPERRQEDGSFLESGIFEAVPIDRTPRT